MSQLDGTIQHTQAVTPSDTEDLPGGISAGLHVNASGNVKYDDAFGNTVTEYLLAGVPYPYRCKRVHATDTTATGIHALYF